MTGHNNATFFRLLKTPIDDKGTRLAAQIATLNTTGQAEETHTLNPADFALIPGSPFAYWAPKVMLRIFSEYPSFEGNGRTAKRGPSTGDDFRRVRAWWEVPAKLIDRHTKWVPFAKGGAFSSYYFDTYLIVDWDEERFTFRDFYGRPGRESPKVEASSYFFRPGITYISRTMQSFCARVLPSGCIFAHISPGIFVPVEQDLFAVMSIMNSTVTDMLLSVSLSRGSETSGQTKAFEVGQVQRLPFAVPSGSMSETLRGLALKAYNLQRNRDRTDETTHAFCLPGLVQHREAATLLHASLALESEVQAVQACLAAIQAEIDDIVFDLYGLDEADRTLVCQEMDQPETLNLEPETIEEDKANGIIPPEDLPTRVQNLLMWCVGVAFGRWDVRMALNPTLLPALQGPFDPLPRCAPGALVGTDGLPPARAAAIAPESWLRARKTVLDVPPPASDRSPCLPVSPSPCPPAWDGILVDDPTHPSDVVTRVRGVLSLLWGDRAGAIEREACEILGVKGLRDYLRDPRKGFFAFHVKRYSKSRRKAPIYWLLQSEKRNYGIWLYIHRLRPDALFVAGREYADAKVALEEARLTELRQGLGTLEGSAQRRREREIERQQKLVAEVTGFRNTLDGVALLKLPPDLNDGVSISIAPLWELVPWKEAQKTWGELVAGKYRWSTMARQMQARGLVKNDKG